MHNAQIEKTVYLVRHGQSEGNLGHIFQGDDSPLTNLGAEQAKHIAARISKLDFDLLVSSPWMRARQTAEEIAIKTNKEIEFSDLFVERIRPSYSSGKLRSDVKAKQLEELWNTSVYAPQLRAEDGENYTDLINRSNKALNFLISKPERSIVVTTHGFFLRVIIARILLGDSLNPISFKSIEQHMGHENTGLTVLKYGTKKGEAKWWVWIYNDHAHLAE